MTHSLIPPLLQCEHTTKRRMVHQNAWTKRDLGKTCEQARSYGYVRVFQLRKEDARQDNTVAAKVTICRHLWLTICLATARVHRARDPRMGHLYRLCSRSLVESSPARGEINGFVPNKKNPLGENGNNELQYPMDSLTPPLAFRLHVLLNDELTKRSKRNPAIDVERPKELPPGGAG
jgi:hypothetical protein